jgi:hypothetical protein
LVAGTVASLGDQLSAEDSDRKPAAADFDFDAELPAPDWLVSRAIERGTVVVLSGDTGAAKSIVTSALIPAALEGRVARPAHEHRALDDHRRGEPRLACASAPARSRRMGHFLAVVVVAIAFGGLNVATSAARPSSTPEPGCVDHIDHGVGNIGDPGDGQEHHNESNGVGNAGDPGNGQGHFCETE